MGSPNMDVKDEAKELSPTPLVSGYFLTAPDGKRIAVPQKLFEKVNRFRIEKLTGHIEIHFRSGGIASAESKVIDRFLG